MNQVSLETEQARRCSTSVNLQDKVFQYDIASNLAWAKTKKRTEEGGSLGEGKDKRR